MPKVRRKNDTGNGRGAGRRRNEGEPFDDLRQHVRDLLATSSEGAAERKTLIEALATFVESLSVDQRKRIRLAWGKSPRSTQMMLHRVLSDSLGGSIGPAGALLRELLEDAKARLDQLPELPEERTLQSAKEWTDIFVRDGWPEAQAREQAATMTRSLDDMTRDAYAAHGMPPELIESALVEQRRNRKFAAVSDAILPERLAAKDRAMERELRPRVEKAAELAARFVEAATELANHVERISLDRRKLSRYYSPGPESVPWWFQFGEQLDEVAGRSDELAAELRAFAAELTRPSGGQTNDVIRRAAEKLQARGLEHRQIAETLVATDIAPADYTAENVRDLLRTGRKPKPPGNG